MRYRLEYLLLVMLAAVVRRIPRRTALSFGSMLGRLGRFVQPTRAKIAEDNLRQAFPEKRPEEVRGIVRQVFGHIGTGFIEMLRLDMFEGRHDLTRLFSIEGEEHLREALSMGKGGILLSGHLGFWEAASFVLPSLGLPVGMVVKPMKNPLADRYFRRLRESYGAYIIDRHKGARQILKALQNNHLVGVLMDQHTARKEAVLVPFFGRPAYATPVIARMAMQYQTPVVPIFAYRNPDGTYLVRISPPLTLDQDLSDEGTMAATSLLTKRIEQGIMHDIGQWFWVHRRWKT